MSGASTRPARHRGRAVVEAQVPGLGVGELPLHGQRPGGRGAEVDAAPHGVEQQRHRVRVARRRPVLLAQDPGLQQRHPAQRPLARRQVDRVEQRPRQVLHRQPGGAHLRLERARALLVDLLEREPEALRVAAVPARGSEHADREGQHVAQQVGDRVGHLRVLEREVAQELHPEADVALLVLGDVVHPGAERRQQVVALQVGLDEVLARLGERRLDDDVVHRHRLRELRARAVAPQLVGDPVEVLEGLDEAVGQLAARRLEPARDRAVAEPHDLVHEALEEDGVARLVDLLRGEEVLLLLARRGVDERRQVVGHRVLAVEEQRVVPQRRLALDVGERPVPVLAVLREVVLHRAPVALLPARVEVLVGDLVGSHGHAAGR